MKDKLCAIFLEPVILLIHSGPDDAPPPLLPIFFLFSKERRAENSRLKAHCACQTQNTIGLNLFDKLLYIHLVITLSLVRSLAAPKGALLQYTAQAFASFRFVLCAGEKRAREMNTLMAIRYSLFAIRAPIAKSHI